MQGSNPGEGAVETLPEHQAESGLVTRSELQLATEWLKAIMPEAAAGGWVDGWLGTGLPFSFKFGTRQSDELLQGCRMEQRDEGEEDGSRRTVFTWTEPETGLQVTWELRIFEDFPAADWVLKLKNAGSTDTPMIEDVQALDMRLNHSQAGKPYTLHGAHGGRSQRDDMMPFSLPIPYAQDDRIWLNGEWASSNVYLPFFNVESPDARGVMLGVGWSGEWESMLAVEGTELNARMGLKWTHFVLHPGEEVRTPRVLVMPWQGKRLHGQNLFRRLIRRHYVPSLPGKRTFPMVSANAAFTYHYPGAFLHQATDKEVLPLVEPFARLGTELFIIDAGWFDGAPWGDWLGNWTISKEKYPKGFKPIAQALASAGMDFGVWFACENISGNAPVVKEHAEYTRPAPGNERLALRAELPEARKWFLDHVSHLVESEGMTCYRQDGLCRFEQDQPYRKGIWELRHVAGLYELWDEIVRRHPDLVMEGCAGGGRRIDLETISRFHWHQKSDRWLDTESDQCSLYGANMFLPGGIINMPTGRMDDYGAWSSFGGQLLLAFHPLDEDFPHEQARMQVERYKRFRSVLSGDFYPLTPCSLNESWIGYQFHRTDEDRGGVLMFRRTGSQEAGYHVDDTFTASLRGLDPGARYKVHFESAGRDEQIMGSELAAGLPITIKDAPGAEMITYERA